LPGSFPDARQGRHLVALSPHRRCGCP
jgi:hypothetical protein